MRPGPTVMLRQLRGLDRSLLLVLTAGLLAVAAAAVAAAVLDRTFGDLSRDPTAVAGVSFYLGAFSIATLLVWWTGAVAAALGALVGERSRPLLLGALLTAALVADDAFQLHEELLPALGVPQQLVLVVYATVAAGFFVTQRRWLASGPWPVLAAAVALLAVSAAADVVAAAADRELHVIEDGAKFVGAALWSAFFVRAATAALTPATRP